MAVVSLIIPALNEAAAFSGSFVTSLIRLRDAFDPAVLEIIVVDGGSTDETVSLASRFAAKVVEAERGRSLQMNRGAALASGQILVFLHADTRLVSASDQIREALLEFNASSACWGRLRVRLSGSRPIFRLIGFMMELRSRLTGICTGDQTLVIRRSSFENIGGFALLPLMEDIDISRRLKRIAAPVRLPILTETSSRRWEQHGVLRTILLMWRLRLAFYLGVSPARLAASYAAR